MSASFDSPLVGVDIGSTTVKAVAVDSANEMVWRDYQRHETRQTEKLLEFLERMEALGVAGPGCRIFFTGSGGRSLAPLVGAKFVQEVHAVSLAVEKLYPEARSAVELGGQDAKIIVFKPGPEGQGKRRICSMNDKCAGGTGAVIDRIAAKLQISPSQLGDQGYGGIRLYSVAGKCGVFAETDINSLQKLGATREQLMASLFEAIIVQNLSVLARGHTLHPQVVLLGGPNTFIRGMREAWRNSLPRMWVERGVQVPSDKSLEELVTAPRDGHYFAALGAVEYARGESASTGRYKGTRELEEYLRQGRTKEKLRSGTSALVGSAEELATFSRRYQLPRFHPASFDRGQNVSAFIGLDGGSTSTKAVLLSENKQVLCKAYQLSGGNPIQETIDVLENLRAQVEGQGARLKILGAGTTGYAKDVLADVIRADVALVETAAHAQSALEYYRNPDVIVDVGGQDIKLIVLKDGRVKDFMLNTQCSAGNGYFLQSTVEGLGHAVDEYAELAFSARLMPVFSFGCAVFLQADIVNFQRQGWTSEEILAGLAAVLPKNIWLYVAKIPNLARAGKRFILQGGTQRNLAAVKAQVDFIRQRFADSGEEPDIVVHEHCGEAGAIGAALEARRLWCQGKRTTFIGLDAVRQITYRTTSSEDTRCVFCKNRCLRTFIDFRLEVPAREGPSTESKVPLGPGEQRLIVSTCEKGAVEDVSSMRQIKARLERVQDANPNLVEVAARRVWASRRPGCVSDPLPGRAWTEKSRRRVSLMRRRKRLRIGIPRVLDLYHFAPLFSGYLESLGLAAANIVYSDFTSEQLYREGARRGAVDPCFPSKVVNSHVHNLIEVHHRRRPLDGLFFPMLDVLRSPLVEVQAKNACPTVSITPEAVKASFCKESDLFVEKGIRYLNPLVNLDDRKLFTRQMFCCWGPVLGLSEPENERAVESGIKALKAYETEIQTLAADLLESLEGDGRLGVVMLGRCYHHDPGLNHGILEELQKLGYPIFSQSTLPQHPRVLERLFGSEVRAGLIKHPMDITDVWKNAYAAGSSLKIWAAKFTARHPNLVALELSSFKCGHDAPTYSVIEEIVESSGTPFFSFREIDENKPVGSIRIRIETIHYFLSRYRDRLRQSGSQAR